MGQKKGYKWPEHRRERSKGINNPNWKGGRVNFTDGRTLIYCPDHPSPNWGKTHVFEYRLIAEKKIGRYLRKGEIVHHIDGDPTNNDPDNLEVMTQSDHAKITVRKRCKKTGRYK